MSKKFFEALDNDISKLKAQAIKGRIGRYFEARLKPIVTFKEIDPCHAEAAAVSTIKTPESFKSNQLKAQFLKSIMGTPEFKIAEWNQRFAVKAFITHYDRTSPLKSKFDPTKLNHVNSFLADRSAFTLPAATPANKRKLQLIIDIEYPEDILKFENGELVDFDELDSRGGDCDCCGCDPCRCDEDEAKRDEEEEEEEE